MHSLDFEEFLWANGVPEETIASVHQSFLLRKPVDDYINTRLMDLFKKYMIVGGMPAVVMEYLKSREFGGVLMRQRSIVQSYRDDISKYAGKRKGEAKRVFDSIPAQLMEKNKRFKLSDIDPNARSRTYHDAIMWLYDAGIATFCYNVTSPEIPFELNEKRNIFKFFMRDTGLLSSMSLGNIQSAILAGDLQINEGAIVENAIADLLVKRGYNLHYWDVKGRLEVDFLIHESHAVLPVEVKSGKDYSKHPSLTRLIDLHREHIPEAIVLHRGQVHKDHNISYLPLYMVMFL
jgi:predicted AAA+ superfamily ATPase